MLTCTRLVATMPAAPHTIGAGMGNVSVRSNAAVMDDVEWPLGNELVDGFRKE